MAEACRLSGGEGAPKFSAVPSIHEWVGFAATGIEAAGVLIMVLGAVVAGALTLMDVRRRGWPIAYTSPSRPISAAGRGSSSLT